jgi:agmatine deiminase
MRMPAEWEPHERTLMGWPCRVELWDSTIEQAKADYAAVANAIAAFEPVTMIANPGSDAAEARAACGTGVEVVELGLDDSWLRDCGPIYVYGADGRRLAVHFRFNAWGEKFHPYDRDAEVGGLIAAELGDEVVTAPLVLEGGSIIGDGEGTLLTTEECLLHPNRNGGLPREEIERALIEHLGIARVVWLAFGMVEDKDTDGHVDLIASFCGRARAVLLSPGVENPNYERAQDDLARLRAAGIEVLELPFLPYAEVAGTTVAASYLNYYICNGAVIVPVTGAEFDSEALAVIGGAYPGREVVPVPGAVLAYGGGGPHCITQQVPVRDAA